MRNTLTWYEDRVTIFPMAVLGGVRANGTQPYSTL